VVVAPIGAGGMGEVYRARDTKLNRDVALKILPDAFANDPDRLARFTREAQTLAALNDPHIAHIHGLEEQNGVRALAMEFVDGEDLAERLTRGPIPLDESLAIAKQIVEGLEAAHDQGIIHRDLKPANIKLTPDGVIKILDFGLAKAIDPMASSPAAAALTHSPTITTPAAMTAAGMILGTAAYMAPEQAKGRPVDKRADVWAFGCVLFEMLTARRAFEGEDLTDVIAAVVRGEPDWTALPRETPEQIKLLLKRCLDKDRRSRIADVSTIRFLLTETLAPAAAAPAAAPAVTAKPRHRAHVPLAAVLGLTAGLLVATAAWAYVRSGDRPPQPMRFAIVPPPAQPLLTDFPDHDIAITPDGTHIVYRGGSSTQQAQLFVRAIDQLDARALPGIPPFIEPFVSPDGQWIAFFTGSTIMKVSITGGPPIVLCTYRGDPRGASWGPDGTIVFATSDSTIGLQSVPAGGGEPKTMSTPDRAHGEVDDVFPYVLPGGKAVLFTVTSTVSAVGQIGVLDLTTGQRKVLIRGGMQAHYVDPSSGSGPGYLVYAAGGTLRGVRFDLKRLEVISDPVPIVEQLMTASTGEANFALSKNGTLVYVPGGVGGGQSARRSLVWVDRKGKEEPIKAPPRAYMYPRISPDGTRVALDIRDQENDVWVWDLARETLTRLTFDPTQDRLGIWTPDGKRIIFSSERKGGASLFWQPADGTGTAEQLTTGSDTTVQFPGSVSPDGTRMVLREDGPKTGRDVSVLALDGKSKATPLIQTTFFEENPEISPDGHWLAYQSNDSGQDQIFVRPFPNVNGGRWQISTAGGTRPAWARNGKELFYLNPMRVLTTVPVKLTDTTFSAGNPSHVFETPYAVPQSARTYDVSPDGQRFLMIKDAEASAATTAPSGMVVVLNWFEELKARVPVK